MVKIVKRGKDIINNWLAVRQLAWKKGKDGEMGERKKGEVEEERKNENAPGMILMLHLVFTFQGNKSCNIQPKIQTSWFLHPAGRLGFYKSPRSFSHYISLLLSLSLAPSLSLLHVQDRNNMEEISCTAERRPGWVGGQEEMMRWRVGWGAKFKNISDCRTQGWATAVHQHTFNFSYFCCFFHNV